MSLLQNSILATLIYYDILDFPLMPTEICQYLITPKRLSRDFFGEKVFVENVSGSLGELVKNGLVESGGGFYFLSGRKELVSLRNKKEKIAMKKWKRFLRISKWFAMVPYLRGFFASGSLAINNTDEESDFDVLIVARSGRLYTCRIFLSLMASLFGARRKRYDTMAPDKFCFNHYIADGNLNIKHESLYNAQSYVNLRPVLAENLVFEKFLNSNQWIGKYIHDPSLAEKKFSVKIKPSPGLLFLGKTTEVVLDLFFGDKLENYFKKYQQKRIKNNPATFEPGGRVVFNDNELEFHPRSFEALAIDKYNKDLKRLGVVFREEEKDSGLLQ